MRFIVLPLFLTACSVDLGPWQLHLTQRSTGASNSTSVVPPTRTDPCNWGYSIHLEADGVSVTEEVGISLLGMPAEGRIHYRTVGPPTNATVHIDGTRLDGDRTVDIEGCVRRPGSGEDTCTVPVRLELIPEAGMRATTEVEFCVEYAGNTWDHSWSR